MSAAPRHLDWDSDFFGFGVSEAVLDAPAPGGVAELAEAARAQDAALLVIRAPAGALEPRQIPGLLADTRHIYAMPPHRPVPDWPGSLRELEQYDATELTPDLACLAVESGCQSRFFRDPDFPNASAEALYVRWIERIVTRDLASRVLLLVDRDREGVISAMGATYIDGEGRGVPSLMAALPGRASAGFGRAYFHAMMRWLRAEGVTKARIRTQARARAACNLYQRAGWMLERREDIFHVWLRKLDAKSGAAAGTPSL